MSTSSSADQAQRRRSSGDASDTGQGELAGPAATGPPGTLPYAGQVVRHVLLRRNIVIDAETAQLVAAAVQAALQAGEPSRRPGRGPRVPGVGCGPLS